MGIFKKEPYETRGADLELTKTEHAFIHTYLHAQVISEEDEIGICPLTPGSPDVGNYSGWLVRGDVMMHKADALSFFRRLDRLVAEYESENGELTAGKDLTLDSIAESFVAARGGKANQFSKWAEDLAEQVQQLAESYGPTTTRGVQIVLEAEPEDFSTRLKYFCDDQLPSG